MALTAIEVPPDADRGVYWDVIHNRRHHVRSMLRRYKARMVIEVSIMFLVVGGVMSASGPGWLGIPALIALALNVAGHNAAVCRLENELETLANPVLAPARVAR